MDNAALQALIGAQLVLARLDLGKGGGNMGIELFPLGRELHALRRAGKERAAQLGLQPVDRARDVGLVAVKRCGCL